MGNNPSDIKTEPIVIPTLINDASPSTETPSSTPNTPLKHLKLTMCQFPSTSSNRIALTDRVVSDRLSELAAQFWQNNIGPLPLEDRLEIAKAIWLGMLSDPSIQTICTGRFNTDEDLETTALKVLDMIGFIMRSVYTFNARLPRLLHQLGHLHTQMGVTFKHYRIMFDHVNRTLKQHFPMRYTKTMSFVMSEIFSYSVQLMTGQDIKICAPLTDLSCLRSLRYCIKHTVGREYMFKYLHHVYCDEMVVFLHLLSEYKSTSNATRRCVIAKHIAEMCLSANGCFAINLSYDTRQQMLQCIEAMDEYDPDLSMEMDLFVDIEDQMCRLIMQSHWKSFKTHMNEIYLFD